MQVVSPELFYLIGLAHQKVSFPLLANFLNLCATENGLLTLESL